MTGRLPIISPNSIIKESDAIPASSIHIDYSEPLLQSHRAPRRGLTGEKITMMFETKAAQAAYWKENLRLMLILLLIWFAVSFGCGILLADTLNAFRFFGFKLGFWFAQQGSIYTFIVLIAVYVRGMNRLDRKYRVNED
jgi:putative solute:sodium symporter small subunit